MKPYHEQPGAELWLGDALTLSRELLDQSVDCIVTSPPYFGLRDYGIQGQYGLESSPVKYVERLRELFGELHRALANDGTLWLNLGDSYASTGGHTSAGSSSQRVGRSSVAIQNSVGQKNNSGLPIKNMLGIPWRVAFALQDSGWILRNAIVWNKTNAMPESVTDRLSKRYEHVFLFSKTRKYHFDLDTIREPQAAVSVARAERGNARTRDGWGQAHKGNPPTGLMQQSTRKTDLGRNPGDVWNIATQPFPEAHFATFPVELPRRCIAAGCVPGGTVLDPFSGSGTTGLAALLLERFYVGFELNPEYLDLSIKHRLTDQAVAKARKALT